MRSRACVRLTLLAPRSPAGSRSPRGASTLGENAPWGLSADRAERFGRKAADTNAMKANEKRDVGLDTSSAPFSPEFRWTEPHHMSCETGSARKRCEPPDKQLSRFSCALQ